VATYLQTKQAQQWSVFLLGYRQSHRILPPGHDAVDLPAVVFQGIKTGVHTLANIAGKRL